MTPLVGVSCTVPVESSLLHCIGTGELSKEGTFPLPADSRELRRKHSDAALFPRMCQFFSLYFAAMLSERVLQPLRPNRVGFPGDGDEARQALSVIVTPVAR